MASGEVRHARLYRTQTLTVSVAGPQSHLISNDDASPHEPRCHVQMSEGASIHIAEKPGVYFLVWMREIYVTEVNLLRCPTHRSRTLFRILFRSDIRIVLRHSCRRAIVLSVVFSPSCMLILDDVSLCRADTVSPTRSGSMVVCSEDGLRTPSAICRMSSIFIVLSDVIHSKYSIPAHLTFLGAHDGIV